MLRGMIFDIVRRPVFPDRLIEMAATPEAAHPGEGRDPDHMTKPPASDGAIASSPVCNAPYNLDSGLRRDERILGAGQCASLLTGSATMTETPSIRPLGIECLAAGEFSPTAPSIIVRWFVNKFGLAVMSAIFLSGCSHGGGALTTSEPGFICSSGVARIYFMENSPVFAPTTSKTMWWPAATAAACQISEVTVTGLPDPGPHGLAQQRAQNVARAFELYGIPKPKFVLGESVEQDEASVSLEVSPK
ncbi:hypothetical protein D3C86_1517820 [compost metagenome]